LYWKSLSIGIVIAAQHNMVSLFKRILPVLLLCAVFALVVTQHMVALIIFMALLFVVMFIELRTG